MVQSAVRRRPLVKISVLLIACVLGIALALLSVLIERRGTELLAYGNLCGPDASQECYEPALKGGFPLAYLTDMPGVSVEHQLSFGEDTLHAGALVLDIAFYKRRDALPSLARIMAPARHLRPPNGRHSSAEPPFEAEGRQRGVELPWHFAHR